MNDVRARLEAVVSRLAAACERAGRDPSSVRLVAVSKTKPASAIVEAYEAGQRDFGENYVQELAEKAAALAHLPDLRFHFIGHLQRNKAKVAVRTASAVHTLDSVRLAEEVGKRAAEGPLPRVMAFGGPAGRLPVLVEVNVGGEAQKSGCAPGELAAVLESVEAQPALRLVGLMTVPPHTEDPAGARPFFEELRRLRDANGGPARLAELSMGMTHDLEHAVLAGATVVRVGTAIFGEREPRPKEG
ncbi:MAG TPA: YggS family pyridoxal phosphate-dependent enzyme [Polyangiaceae bacterium]|nr:YggS family pyridoxal phosphate-dependent enzyme [Polyangiaceae bacterium]